MKGQNCVIWQKFKSGKTYMVGNFETIEEARAEIDRQISTLEKDIREECALREGCQLEDMTIVKDSVSEQVTVVASMRRHNIIYEVSCILYISY